MYPVCFNESDVAIDRRCIPNFSIVESRGTLEDVFPLLE